MKLNKIILAIGLGVAAVGVANAANVSKKITLTAQINDAIFVSKADGATWYGTEELEAADYRQQSFSKTLPVRVWTKNSDFKVSLQQPLKMTNGVYEMKNAKVSLTSGAGTGEVKFGSALTVKQVTTTADGFDEVHNVTVHVDAPTKTTGGPDTNGSYSGDLVMVFEPVAATGTGGSGGSGTPTP
ncbi:fimbrial assembly protein [Achromobacter sp. AONIH1]|jgi:hypothetical protein|uniref:fimbrial assembly protein n=1 Tax=unclassified Achromobacter TaxID=2626865 RepID=UPI000CD2852C|nr:fimbrial assembly protein [Achromobacter sp. AONIH1]AUT47301.1 fimbrial assembly protein [Achromobacter sp. AONIH1]